MKNIRYVTLLIFREETEETLEQSFIIVNLKKPTMKIIRLKMKYRMKGWRERRNQRLLRS